LTEEEVRPGVARAHVFLFHLDDLRSRYGAAVPEEHHRGSDTASFLTFRSRLLAELAPCVQRQAELSAWWEGTYNGYHLAVAVSPASALSTAFDPESICPLEAERVAPLPRNGYPLARLAPGGWELAQGAAGETYAFPFGAATGHFGAPGVLVQSASSQATRREREEP
jgi:hypothetical protein